MRQGPKKRAPLEPRPPPTKILRCRRTPASGSAATTRSPRRNSYLDTLARQAGEELPTALSKAEASQQIDRLKSQLGIGDQRMPLEQGRPG